MAALQTLKGGCGFLPDISGWPLLRLWHASAGAGLPICHSAPSLGRVFYGNRKPTLRQASACGLETSAYHPERLAAFWSWWLDDALPLAFKLADANWLYQSGDSTVSG
ncbi:hypothetical protein [Deinococcus aquatilis]|uniref:hypothetical protein n=1 Tax=Deinococcus aquatilis TaxID=519440 RepID=UPI0012FC5AF0|nr:hypothetical protein [Deinococcus aquatilis]